MTERLSIIIPTYNEERFIGRLLERLYNGHGLTTVPEIIIVDGGSTDGTINLIPEWVTLVHSPVTRRSVQLNMGAQKATGNILHFVHADSIPPRDFGKAIKKVLHGEVVAGCFTSVFDWPHPFLRFCNWFSRWPFDWCRGGGQTLYVRRESFFSLGGFNETMYLMEEYDLIQRLKQMGKFSIIKKNVITSARDYREHGAFRLQLIYSRIMWHYLRGASQKELAAILHQFMPGAQSRLADKSRDSKS